MEHFAGIDVSLEQSSVCVVEAVGKIVREAKVASEPEDLVRFFRELGVRVVRIGLEAGPEAELPQRFRVQYLERFRKSAFVGQYVGM